MDESGEYDIGHEWWFGESRLTFSEVISLLPDVIKRKQDKEPLTQS